MKIKLVPTRSAADRTGRPLSPAQPANNPPPGRNTTGRASHHGRTMSPAALATLYQLRGGAAS